ncbi:MAG: TetR/AcrR family transcriptional regulator [Bdellovibrionia bacterium]
MKTKKGEKEKLRRTILDQAIAYFKKHGRSGSGTEDIMKRIGLTRGALYSHFKSKDDFFAQSVCHDLGQLEESLKARFQKDSTTALKSIIVDHLSEKSLVEIENSCAFTSLSSDMQRCKATHRALYEDYMIRIYDLFSKALQDQFPEDSPEENHDRALNLYSSLVGTLTMARTMKDPKRARNILESGKRLLIQSYVPKA